MLGLTFVRPGTIAAAKWEHFNLRGAFWVVPFEGLKMATERSEAGKSEDDYVIPLSRQAVALLRELHKITHQPVNLSMRQGDEIVYIERAYSERSGMQVVRAIGGRAPLHLTSVGKLFLAHDDPQRVRAYASRTGLASAL